MTRVLILQQFKKQLISFIDELVGQFPAEGDLIFIRVFLGNQVPIIDVMDEFMVLLESTYEESYTPRDMVKNRDEMFFLMNDSMFQRLSKGKVNHFKKLWRSQLDDDEKKIVWSWIDSLVFLGDKYKNFEG